MQSLQSTATPTFCVKSPGLPACRGLPGRRRALLANHDVPHLIVGGLAVQEHGYPRVTIDMDIVVPGVSEAVAFLTASLSGPFCRVSETADSVEDRRTHTFVDLRPAGPVIKDGYQVPFPQPTKATVDLQIATLEELVSLKLDSWKNRPLKRLRDKTDVVELILRRKLPRSRVVDHVIRPLYEEVWDAPQAETEAPRLDHVRGRMRSSDSAQASANAGSLIAVSNSFTGTSERRLSFRAE